MGSGSDIHGGRFPLGIHMPGFHLSADIVGTRAIAEADLDGFLFWPPPVVPTGI